MLQQLTLKPIAEGGGVGASYRRHCNGMDFSECEASAGFGNFRVWFHNLDTSGDEYGRAEEVKILAKYEVDVS